MGRAPSPSEAPCRVRGVSSLGFSPGSTDRPARRPSATRGARRARSARPIETPGSTYGSPRVHRELAGARRGLAARTPWPSSCAGTTSAPRPGDGSCPRTTESRHDRPVPENALARGTNSIGPTRPGSPTSPTSRRPRAGSTWRWSSTSALRKVVGWATADHLRTDLTLEARWRWPRLTAGRPRGCSTTATAGSNTPAMPLAGRWPVMGSRRA